VQRRHPQQLCLLRDAVAAAVCVWAQEGGLLQQAPSNCKAGGEQPLSAQITAVEWVHVCTIGDIRGGGE
jgi:hypothetical protein